MFKYLSRIIFLIIKKNKIKRKIRLMTLTDRKLFRKIILQKIEVNNQEAVLYSFGNYADSSKLRYIVKQMKINQSIFPRLLSLKYHDNYIEGPIAILPHGDYVSISILDFKVEKTLFIIKLKFESDEREVLFQDRYEGDLKLLDWSVKLPPLASRTAPEEKMEN